MSRSRRSRRFGDLGPTEAVDTERMLVELVLGADPDALADLRDYWTANGYMKTAAHPDTRRRRHRPPRPPRSGVTPDARPC